MKKIYVVTTQSQCDYDFSVTTLKHGAFFDPQNALNRLIEVVKTFKSNHEYEFNKYSNKECYVDELNGALVETEDFENGYWSCSFGFQDDHQCHSICIDEFNVEDELTFEPNDMNYNVEDEVPVLEIADLLEFDPNTYNIKVDKQIFDSYEPNTCIELQLFGTNVPDEILAYVMVDEDEDGIMMHCLID